MAEDFGKLATGISDLLTQYRRLVRNIDNGIARGYVILGIAIFPSGVICSLKLDWEVCTGSGV